LTMIAAPDVVARTVDPGDFLEFVSGRISANFITSGTELDRRLATLDVTPDPDGRYRVNEFCCENNTWQATAVSLIDGADVVLMDLRGWSPIHGGSTFELQQLPARIPSDRIVLVIDDATDCDLIKSAMGILPKRIVTLMDNSDAATDALFRELLRAVTGRGNAIASQSPNRSGPKPGTAVRSGQLQMRHLVSACAAALQRVQQGQGQARPTRQAQELARASGSREPTCDQDQQNCPRQMLQRNLSPARRSQRS
jgi:hypothetical protein